MVTSGKIRYVTKPLPRVLILHTGGTLGMDPRASYVSETHAQGEQVRAAAAGAPRFNANTPLCRRADDDNTLDRLPTEPTLFGCGDGDA